MPSLPAATNHEYTAKNIFLNPFYRAVCLYNVHGIIAISKNMLNGGIRLAMQEYANLPITAKYLAQDNSMYSTSHDRLADERFLGLEFVVRAASVPRLRLNTVSPGIEPATVHCESDAGTGSIKAPVVRAIRSAPFVFGDEPACTGSTAYKVDLTVPIVNPHFGKSTTSFWRQSGRQKPVMIDGWIFHFVCSDSIPGCLLSSR